MSNPNSKGRPKLDNPRDKNLVIRVTAKEKANAHKNAQKAGLELSEFLRKTLKNAME